MGLSTLPDLPALACLNRPLAELLTPRECLAGRVGKWGGNLPSPAIYTYTYWKVDPDGGIPDPGLPGPDWLPACAGWVVSGIQL